MHLEFRNTRVFLWKSPIKVAKSITPSKTPSLERDVSGGTQQEPEVIAALYLLIFRRSSSCWLNVVSFNIVEIQGKTGHNLQKFSKEVSLDRQWLDLFKENKHILSGRQVTQSLLCRLSQNTFL